MKVIIAGGNGLIGSALVKAFRKRGSEVVCADINGSGEYFNMKYPETLEMIFDRHRPIDAFVNCVYPKDWETAFKGWCDCTVLVANELSENGGSIVNFGSIYGMVGPDTRIHKDCEMVKPTVEYAFIKGGIINATKFIAVEYAKCGVRCNVISPGGVFDNQPDQFVKRYTEKCPMGRMAIPEDIIEAVWFLINQGSEYVSGCNIPIDGGWTAW